MRQRLILCRTCGKEMAADAKACPNCGAKNKRPVFKKWWFWMLVVLAVGGAAASGGEKDPRQSAPPKTVETTAPASPEKEQTPAPAVESKEADVDSNETTGQKNALKSAKNYLDLMAFSRDGLITQLEFEGYTHAQAVYGAEANGY